MAKERPQLNVDELHRVRWLLGGTLALVSVWSVVFLDVNAWALIILSSLMTCLALVRPTLPARLPKWVHRLAFPVVVGFFIFDFYAFGQLLPAIIRLGILLLGYRASTYRKRRDDLQLVLLGLFLIVATGVLTVSIAFAGQIVLFAALALALLFTRTLVDASESKEKSERVEEGAPTWARGSWRPLWKRLWLVSDWRLAGAAVILFVGLVALSGFLFLAIPRFQLENSLSLDRWMNKHSVTGFSDTLRFGEISEIEEDDSVAMRVEISDPRELPEELYWRMTVLDEYKEHSFHLSAAVRERAFGREINRSQIGAFGLPARLGRASWTFYVEPGVSRFLPLAGGFSHLTFTEPQAFRASEILRMIMLARDPATMKAYRVDRMDTTGQELNPRSRGLPETSEKWVPTSTKELPFDEAERAQWRTLAAEINGARPLPSVEFTRAAIAWLHHRHAYSLRSKLPPGTSDPLLGWTTSDQPGHCELFAGAFAMLARANGFPVRIVAGFLGGDWNGDYLIVRNSSAHAWCELLDERGAWVRVDPTIPPTDQTNRSQDTDEALRRRLHVDTGWGARFDRLRMLWYRHIVNFEQRDQIDLVRSLQGQTDSSGKRIQMLFETLTLALRRWFAGPWDLPRIKRTAALVGVAVFVIWSGWRVVRVCRSSAWFVRRRKSDPIRAEAGKWLLRLDTNDAMRPALQRLRYGRRETWPDPRSTFRQARRTRKKNL